jgi:hypothetical protein
MKKVLYLFCNLAFLSVFLVAAGPAPNRIILSENDKDAVLTSFKDYWQSWFESNSLPNLKAIQALVYSSMFYGHDKPIYQQLQSYNVYGKTSASINSPNFSDWEIFCYSEEINGEQKIKTVIRSQANDMKIIFLIWMIYALNETTLPQRISAVLGNLSDITTRKLIPGKLLASLHPIKEINNGYSQEAVSSL